MGHVSPRRLALKFLVGLRLRPPRQPNQPLGAASSVPAYCAGSKPKPREVTPALNAFILGKLYFGEGTTSLSYSWNLQPSPYWSFYLLTQLPCPSHSLYSALPKTHAHVAPWPCSRLPMSSAKLFLRLAKLHVSLKVCPSDVGFPYKHPSVSPQSPRLSISQPPPGGGRAQSLDELKEAPHRGTS